jgi:hypothetical protein
MVNFGCGGSGTTRSDAGSAKIARAIWRIVGAHDFSSPHTVVFGKEVLSE